jgi:hypothetical protein
VAAAKLPANAIIGEAYGFVFGNLRPLARAAAVPFGIMTVGLLRSMLAEREGGMPIYAVALWMIIEFGAAIPFQTQVYRFATAMTADRTPQLGWPWGRRETAYLLNAIGLMIASIVAAALAGAIVAAVMLPGGGGTREEQMARLGLALLFIGVPLALVIAYASARISPVFPAAAVGHPTNWRVLWRATEGNGWRIFWIMVIAILPWSLAGGFIQTIAGLMPGPFTLLVLGTVANVASLIGMAMPAAALGLVYRHIAPGLGPPARLSLLV